MTNLLPKELLRTGVTIKFMHGEFVHIHWPNGPVKGRKSSVLPCGGWRLALVSQDPVHQQTLYTVFVRCTHYHSGSTLYSSVLNKLFQLHQASAAHYTKQ